MNEQEMLLRKIAQTGFILFELHLFLNTHPYDQQALDMFRKYSKIAEDLHNEYVRKYGPLSNRDVSEKNMWQWIKDPWPWDYSPEEGL